jgi:hypothetical protein
MKQQKQQKEYGKKFFVPILLILAVLPLITNAHIYDNGLRNNYGHRQMVR